MNNNINKNISVWRGNNTPPTEYHLWIKDDNSIWLYYQEQWHNITEYLQLATPEQNGLMSSSDKSKLDNIENNAQVNVIESISIDNIKQIIDNKNVNLDTYTKSTIDSKIQEHTTNHNNPHEVTKQQIGLGNVDNTSDIDKPISTATQQALNNIQNTVQSTKKELANTINQHKSDNNNPHQVTKSQVGLGNVTNDAQVKRSEMGTSNGVATLNDLGQVPAHQLPSFVDDVVDVYATYDKSDTGKLSNIKLFSDIDKSIAITGESGKTYIDVEGLYQFRWTGSMFVALGTPTVIGDVPGTAFDGARGKALETSVNSHISDTSNPHQVTKEQVGLGNVDNTSDLNKPISTATQSALNNKVDKVTGKSLVSNSQITKLEGLDDQDTLTSKIADAKKAGTDASSLATQNKNTIDNYTINGQKISTNPNLSKNDVGLSNVTNEAQIPLSQRGIANGVATLDDAGKVPSSQLPSYVDDVLEYNTYDSFPETGESGKIYIDKQTNKQYRWGGTAYTEISKSLALGETSSTAYPGDKGKQTTDTLNSHVGNTSNPHNVTKAQVGLGNVDNTSDTNKPVSTAQQEAINSAKTEVINTVGGYTINGKKINTNPTLNKGDIGLDQVDNTSDLDKPISNATQNALNQKQDLMDYISEDTEQGYIAIGNSDFYGFVTGLKGKIGISKIESVLIGNNVLSTLHLTGTKNSTTYKVVSPSSSGYWMMKNCPIQYFSNRKVKSKDKVSENSEDTKAYYAIVTSIDVENETITVSETLNPYTDFNDYSASVGGYADYCSLAMGSGRAEGFSIGGWDCLSVPIANGDGASIAMGCRCIAIQNNTCAFNWQTISTNFGESAFGISNKSNTGSTDDQKTLFSIGNGTQYFNNWESSKQKNAIEVMKNGDFYVDNIGGYDGTNYSEAQTLQETINELPKEFKTINGQTITGSGDITIEGGGDYTLPIASADTLGGIKVGEGLNIDGEGVLSSTGSGVGQVDPNSYNSTGEIFNTYSSDVGGWGNKATGSYSHAEGHGTKASGSCAHTEGQQTTASEECAHAEGSSTTASGYYSHTEGVDTKAKGSGSHAEGINNTASGGYSHAEGNTTVANGDGSHTEGYGTEANNQAEHAQGTYNISNTGSTNADKTIHSIGIGDRMKKKNAVEVMANGDAYIIGLGGYDGTNPQSAQTLQEISNISIESVASYGIEFDTEISTPTCTRIGNLELHRELPIQSNMKGCILNDNGEVVEYLPNNDWSDTDGSKGQVMVEIPEHYRKCITDGTKQKIYISEIPLAGYHKVPKMYISAYEATVQRSSNKLCSVSTTDTDYRGGNNNSSWDNTYRSFLGTPATQISRTNYRTYARNRKSDSTRWNCYTYEAHKTLFWLFAIEYATLNSQSSYNSQLTNEGFHQGGLGAGVTNLDWNKWLQFNSNGPFITCGYTDSIGNSTGVKSYTMPFQYDSGGESNYSGEYNSSQLYINGKYVSSGDLLYKCILDTTSGTELTNTTYFTKVNRTVVSVPRYRGIENPFGHIWKWADGINIKINPTSENGGNNLSEVYICNYPENFTDSSYDNYIYIGNEARTEAFVKKIIFGEYGDIIPIEVGGSSSTYFCDYHYTNIPSSISLRGLLCGGRSHDGSGVGFGSLNSSTAPSAADLGSGSRLCFV